MTTMAIVMRRVMRRTLPALILVVVAAPLGAQGMSNGGATRVTAISGVLLHGSAVVVDPQGISDTRLSAGPTFGLEVQQAMFSFGSIYAGVAGSFSTLEHGANLGVSAGPGTSGVTLILGAAGLVMDADWFGPNLRPTLRLGGGVKAYTFTMNGASSFVSFTGDVGVGFRGGSGPIEVSGEIRVLPSTFDQAKIPLRGFAPQDQNQMDVLFSIGVTIRP